MTEAGLMASMVLAFSAAGTLTGGYQLDWFASRGGIGRKRLLGGCSFFPASAMLGCDLLSGNPWLAAFFAALSCFSTQAKQSLWWTCSIGISGKHIGALFGLMNSVGVFGAMSGQYPVGAPADFPGATGYTGRDQWDKIFHINMGVLIVAGLPLSSFVFKTVEARDADH